MPLPPVTEEDKKNVERMVLQLKRLRKREADNTSNNWGQSDLDDAIKGLMAYGSIKGWWEYHDH